jgi:hypothetical protein
MTLDDRCAADGHGRQYASRLALGVPTARGNPPAASTMTSSRDVGTHGSARRLRFGALPTVERPVAHPSVAEHGEGPSGPAPGAESIM